jgi:predicted glycosyltransferase
MEQTFNQRRAVSHGLQIKMTTRHAILFYCQHSLGMGHLVRSLALAESLAERFHVMLLNGGRLPKGVVIPAGVQVINLPPLGIDENNQLVSHDKRISVERALDRRKKMIRTCFDNLRPAVVLLELFPFGRKKFAAELRPLLEAANSPETRSLVVCSLRDILVNQRVNQQKYDDRAAMLANQFLDLVLVHSDPTFAHFEESFRPTVRLKVPVIHTGFVVQRLPATACVENPRKRILVSAGGGIVGEPLLQMAIEALSYFEDDPSIEMKVIAGPFLPDEAWNTLRAVARGKTQLSVVRHVSNLCDELRGATVSISQAGYNTCLDVLRAGVPALLVPFARGDENEQRKRALRLHRLGAVRMLDQENLDPMRLAAAIRELTNFQMAKPQFDLNGAERSTQIIESMVKSAIQPKAISYHTCYEN